MEAEEAVGGGFLAKTIYGFGAEELRSPSLGGYSFVHLWRLGQSREGSQLAACPFAPFQTWSLSNGWEITARILWNPAASWGLKRRLRPVRRERNEG